jgi:glycosyltransferase involved in cell wall biosynthesis
MRVLLIGNHWTPGPGGAETMLAGTAQTLRDQGHLVFPFAVRESATLDTPLIDLLPAAAGASARTRFAQAWAGTWSPAAYRATSAAIAAARPDIAQVHHVYERLTTSTLDALRAGGIPTVHVLHDYKAVCPNYRLYRGGAPCTECLNGSYFQVARHRCLEGSRWRSVAAAVEGYAATGRQLYHRVDRLIAPSAFLRDRVVEGGLPRERISVLPNPVAAAPEPSAAPADPPYFVYAGRLVAEKGLDVLLDAARALPPRTRIRIIGGGRLAGRLGERVRLERLPVDLLGAQPPPVVAAQIRGAVAALLPALWWENCPMAVLEAAAQGVPVVACAVGGIPELVHSGDNGLLVPPNDPTALTDAMRELLDDPALVRRLGVAGWRRVRDRHDPQDYGRKLTSVFDEVIAARVSGQARRTGR